MVMGIFNLLTPHLTFTEPLPRLCCNSNKIPSPNPKPEPEPKPYDFIQAAELGLAGIADDGRVFDKNHHSIWK